MISKALSAWETATIDTLENRHYRDNRDAWRVGFDAIPVPATRLSIRIDNIPLTPQPIAMDDDGFVELRCYVPPFEGELLATYRDIKAYVRYSDGMIVLHDRRTNECFEMDDLADLEGFVDETTCNIINAVLLNLPHDHILDKRYRA